MTDMTTKDSSSNIMKFMMKQVGPFDVLVFADGRLRSSRLEIETITEKMRHASEFWVVYKSSARSAERCAPH